MKGFVVPCVAIAAAVSLVLLRELRQRRDREAAVWASATDSL